MIVGLLVGSFVFITDLIRALYRLGCSPRVEFIRLSSYGPGRESSGHVRMIGEVKLDLAGRTVLLVDDIVDTGPTLLYARALLRKNKVANNTGNRPARDAALAGARSDETIAPLGKQSNRAVSIERQSRLKWSLHARIAGSYLRWPRERHCAVLQIMASAAAAAMISAPAEP